jgi:deazaflavin-dependent oxidoreductase (nitroreductase family)
LRDGDAYVIVASNRGLATHPAWYHNLTAEPRVTIEVGGTRLAAQAATADGAERARLWAKIVERYPTSPSIRRG